MGLPTLIDTALPEATESSAAPAPKHRRKASTHGNAGERITEKNAEMLAFAAAFPAADHEAFSVLSFRDHTHFAPGGELPSVGGTDVRLAKLVRLGALQKFRNHSTKTTHFGITKHGVGAAWSFGYPMEHVDYMAGLSLKRLNHYRFIAHVAAQLISPEGFFRDSLGIEPVALSSLVSEKMMRATYSPVREMLKKKAGEEGIADFGRWRNAMLASADKAAGEGRIRWSDIVESKPALLTIGSPQREGSKLKAVHQPDIAVLRDSERASRTARNILVEVELSKKSWADYDAILATLKRELEHGFIYERAVYFTVGTQISSLLKRVDASGHNLIRDGNLTILPILDRNGVPIKINNRVPLGDLS